MGLSAQKERSTVFKSNSEGYAIFRIPAIVSIPNGDLLAFCEGRENIDDFGNVDIVMKRSSDRGKTWSKRKVLVDYGQLQAGNSAPVVDLLDPEYPQGRVLLFYNTGNNHEYDVRIKNGYREVWYITSTDGGHSWSEPTNITTMVHRPNFPSANPEYKFEEDWRTYANTPGHAMQFADGKYKGRLYVAANHSQGPPIAPFSDYFAMGIIQMTMEKLFTLASL